MFPAGRFIPDHAAREAQELLMAVWRWDTVHFTLDDNDNHTYDGWHNDIVVTRPSTLRTFNTGTLADFDTEARDTFATTTNTRRFAA
jgi:hypothetical protein